MNEGFNALWELAKIDRQLVGLKKIKDAFPEDVARQQLRCDAVANALAEVENSLQTLNLELNAAHQEIAANQSEISQLSDKIRIVKNTKEYDIITERIKDIKESIAKNEEQQLTAMEEADSLKKALQEKRAELETEQKALAALNEEIAGKSAEIKGKQKTLVATRNQQITRIETFGKELMETYNAALKRGKGIAFSALNNGVCTECHRKATANIVTLVESGNNLGKCVCDGCGRLLYLDNSQAAE